MKLKYINSDYVPKGQLEGFPLEIIDKMLERQVEQGSKADVEVFEICKRSDKRKRGFDWDKSLEEYFFWKKVILDENFDLFFTRYPKEKQLEFPRIIEVYEDFINEWVPRVCIKIVNNGAVCWENATTFEEAELETETIVCHEWREVQEEPEYKPFDFSDGVMNHLDLLGRKIFSKKDESATTVYELGYNVEAKVSYINALRTDCLLDCYVFENGKPVGIKIK